MPGRDNEIRQKIVLDGEQQYRKALQDAQRNLRTLKSEMRAETAELGNNATAQQKNEVRLKSLQKQIKEQEKIVNTYKRALEEVREKYGDNQDAVQSWERKLNDARTTLANMQNSLEGVGSGFRSIQQDANMGTVATKSFADALGSISDIGSSVADGIESIFTGMVDVVRDAISEVWADMTELAGRANSWVDLAGFWNTDAASIQKWTHAVEGAHNSFDTLNNAVTRINMGDQDKITAATGVSGENYTDKWQYAMAVMDRLAGMDYESRLNAVGEVFGERRALGVLDLLNDWQTIQNNLARFDTENGGIGMTEDQIQEMSELAERIDTLKETWKALKDQVEVGIFGKLSLDIVGNGQAILDDLIAYMNTGDDKELDKLVEDIEKFFDRLKQALENAAKKLDEVGKKLAESDNGLVRTLGKALQGISDALEWISDEGNIDKVIGGLGALAGFWTIGKGASMAAKIAEVVANLKLIRGFGTGSAVGNTVGQTLAGSGTATAISNFITGSTARGTSAFTALGGMGGLPGVTGDILLNQTNAGRALRDGGGIGDALEGLKQDVTEAGDGIKKNAETFGDDLRENVFLGSILDTITGGLWSTIFQKKPEESEKGEDDAAGSMPLNTELLNALKEQTESSQDVSDMLHTLLDGASPTDTLDRWKINQMDDLSGVPADWWQNAGTSGEGLTSQDVQEFGKLPAGMLAAVRQGTREGVANLRVNIDGQAAGRILAPYVSEQIARDVV